MAIATSQRTRSALWVTGNRRRIAWTSPARVPPTCVVPGVHWRLGPLIARVVLISVVSRSMRGDGMGIVKSFPKDWLTDVIVLRGGGHDPRGNPLPTEEIPLADCLIVPRATSERDHFIVPRTDTSIYRDAEPSSAFRSS